MERYFLGHPLWMTFGTDLQTHILLTTHQCWWCSLLLQISILVPWNNISTLQTSSEWRVIDISFFDFIEIYHFHWTVSMSAFTDRFMINTTDSRLRARILLVKVFMIKYGNLIIFNWIKTNRHTNTHYEHSCINKLSYRYRIEAKYLVISLYLD